VTRRERRRSATAIVLATIGAGVVLALGAFSAATVAAVYVVVLGTLVLAPLTRLARVPAETEPSLFELSLRPSASGSGRPPELVRMERELLLGLQTAGGLHNRLVPLLREAAAARLAERRIDLLRQPDAARAALGDEAWQLVRPDRPTPLDRTGPGITTARLRSLLDALEDV
jgi:hypothetical protein